MNTCRYFPNSRRVTLQNCRFQESIEICRDVIHMKNKWQYSINKKTQKRRVWLNVIAFQSFRQLRLTPAVWQWHMYACTQMYACTFHMNIHRMHAHSTCFASSFQSSTPNLHDLQACFPLNQIMVVSHGIQSPPTLFLRFWTLSVSHHGSQKSKVDILVGLSDMALPSRRIRENRLWLKETPSPGRVSYYYVP